MDTTKLPRLTLALLLASLALPLSGLELAGQVRLVEKGSPVSEYAGGVVFFTPEKAPQVEALAEPVEMITARKQFLPRVLAITPGSTVRFPNEDPILHNVFSVSGRNRFDLGFYKKGDEGKEVTFEHPGIVRVFCNVHHQMVAYVVVVETPYITSLDGQGHFELADLPPGPGTLTVWHERAEPLEQQLTLPVAGALDFEVALTRPRVPKHQNKFGKPYTRRKRGKAYD